MAFPSSGLFVATFVDVLDTTQLALDLDLETHKVALFTNSVTGADLTTDTAYGVGAWASNEVPNGSGYTTGGSTLKAAIDRTEALATKTVERLDGIDARVEFLENMKYHGFGTGTTAEAASQTALVTELTTQYATDSTRPTGTTTEGATANIYRTVATLSPDTGGTIAITEHGIFSATSAGVMLDRSVFSAVNLVAASDSMTATYDLTFPSGS